VKLAKIADNLIINFVIKIDDIEKIILIMLRIVATTFNNHTIGVISTRFILCLFLSLGTKIKDK
jgi:hypothetical protein